MLMDDLDYHLPQDRIATRPAEPRDSSRLMVASRAGTLPPEHRRFRDIAQFLRKGDLLIVNNTRVLPAKLLLRKSTGAFVPGLFLAEPAPGTWWVMLRARGKVHPGDTLLTEGRPDYHFHVEQRAGEGLWHISPGGTGQGRPAHEILHAIGHVPLPPYIEKARRDSHAPEETPEDRAWYQTTYAQTGEGHSVAAPTAGLHFTPQLLAQLESAGIRRAAVELEVGMGTFLPVETTTLEEHKMHTERYHIPAATIAAIHETRAAGHRIIAVGTTAVRTLEAAALILEEEKRRGGEGEISGETDLKIAPGYCFRIVDALITNFHLPRSTLMALVAAFLGDGGVARLRALYEQAVREEYRFYSYGDAMFISNDERPR